MAEGAPASTGGLSPESLEGGKRKGKAKASAWLKHVMSVKRANPKFSLGDAMKAAKKTYKKSKAGGGHGAPGIGGMGPMGGRRRGTKKLRRGGALYGFGGDLADGGMAYGHSADATWKGDSTLTGAVPAEPPAKGGRRSRRHRSSKKGTVGGKRRR